MLENRIERREEQGMSAIIIGIGLNLLELGREHIRVSNMLPAIFLPIAYIPLASWLETLLSQFF